MTILTAPARPRVPSNSKEVRVKDMCVATNAPSQRPHNTLEIQLTNLALTKIPGNGNSVCASKVGGGGARVVMRAHRISGAEADVRGAVEVDGGAPRRVRHG
ncbi:uncharacterized protein PG998_014388 [Apiospora kogelbergensis]|uniref:uncharacterized protein n=1 Tax=Apiospora kogelbergensis TaxID=1337665 RepID=UPI00312CF9A8